jgi:uncharacterized membrane protein YfcA
MTTDSPGSTNPPGRLHFGGLLGLGFVIDFLDTLGVGSFATTTTALKIGRLVNDEDIPGTLNVGHALPTILEALLYITVIEVEKVTLVSMIAASAIGAWFGAGVVSRWPRLTIQRALSVALLVTALFIFLRLVHVFPAGGDALQLTGLALVIGLLVNTLLGALTTLGIGNYAPCMALVSILGMNPAAAFPIMMGSAALILPIAAARFIPARRYHARTGLGLTLGGIPGVWVAWKFVTSLPLDAVKWLVVGVLLYTATMMWRSAQQGAAAAAPAPAA